MIDLIVADDDSLGRSAVVEAVRALGYPCREARDGEEALDEYLKKPAALVLTDWNMPRMNGLELCRALKQRESPPYVILMTAFDRRTYLLEGMRGGADDFVRKPIDLDELEVRLIAASRFIHAQRELAIANALLRDESARESRAARTDPLTAVANRLLMEEDLDRVLGNTSRYGHRYSCAICDVDYFKQYNDRYGHLAGDVALQKVALAMRDGLRSGDSVYRYGGDEFFVILPEQGADEAVHALERVRASVEALEIKHGSISKSGVLTISVGVAEAGASTRDEWIARADAALYRAKADGRNCVRVASEPFSSLHAH